MSIEKASYSLESSTGNVASKNGTPVSITNSYIIGTGIAYTVASAAAKTFVNGTDQVDTLTIPAKSAATTADYAELIAADGTKYAVWFQKLLGTKNKDTITFADEATTQSGEHFRCYDTAGNAWGISMVRRNKQRITPADYAGTASGDLCILADTDAASWAFALCKRNVQVLNFADLSGTASGDLAILKDIAGASWGVALCKRGINTITLPAFAAVGDADYFILKDHHGVEFAVSVDKIGVKESTKVIFTTKAGSAAGDHIVFKDHAGVSWAISLNVAGTDPAPSAAVYAAVAAGKKVHVDISGATTAIDVAGLVKTAWDGLTGEDSWFTATDNGDGSINFVRTHEASIANPAVYDNAETGSGSINYATTVNGVDPSAPVGALWTAISAANKNVAHCYGLTTAGEVGTKVYDALVAISGYDTNQAVTDDTSGVLTATQGGVLSQASVTIKNADDSGAGAITTSVSTASTVPSGALWGAIAAGNKALQDVTGLTNDEDIAAAVKTTLEALTGWAAKFTITDNSDGTLSFKSAHNASGSAVGAFVPYAYDEGSAGSIACSVTEAGLVPSGALWTAIAAGKKVRVDIDGLSTAAQLGTAAYTALNLLSGFTAKITLTDNTGTVDAEAGAVGAVSNFAKYAYNELSAGSLTLALTVASTQPSGAVWSSINSARRAIVSVHGLSTAAGVRGAVETAISGLSGFTTVMTTTNSTADLILEAKANAAVTLGSAVAAGGSGAGSSTFTNTTAGVATDSAPTGAVYAAASYKAAADCSAASTAAQCATAFYTAFRALTGFTGKITLVDVGDGSLRATQIVRAAAYTGFVVKNADDSGDGSIAGAATTPGVATVINLVSNAITIASHGFASGRKMALTIGSGSLPAGLSASDYYAYVVDANSIKLCTSYANALAGTAVDITDYGTSGQTCTLTPAAITGVTFKLQGSNSAAGTDWFDLTGQSVSISASGNVYFADAVAAYKRLRGVLTMTDGVSQVDIEASVSVLT
jgi:hypothetical protein